MMEFFDSVSPSSTASPFLTEIADSGDMNELAWHIRESGLMHDSDHADLVRRACLGSGEQCQLLRASVDLDEEDERPALSIVPSRPVCVPQAAPAFQSRPVNRRQAMKANPFMLPKAVCLAAEAGRKGRLRSAVLTDEVARLYRCLSFAMNQYGVTMNGHMTVAWEVLGIRDHVRAAEVLTEFNARMGKWLKVNGNGRKRKGINSTTWGVPERYFYAFVHEHTRDRGFHTHQLIGISDGKARAFAERAVKVLKRLTGVSVVPANAVVFTPGTRGDGFAPYLPRFKKNEVERCWIWFRYLAKNLSPHEFAQFGDRSALQRDIFRIKRVFVQPQLVTCSDLFGCSQNIGMGAQREAGFVSKFDRGDWQNLYDDSDLNEWKFGMMQRRQEEEMTAILANITI